MFMYGNIALTTFSNVPVQEYSCRKAWFLLKWENLNGYAVRASYSKYWNLLVEKANVTTKPSLGPDAAVTSMPILEHRRATR